MTGLKYKSQDTSLCDTDSAKRRLLPLSFYHTRVFPKRHLWQMTKVWDETAYYRIIEQVKRMFLLYLIILFRAVRALEGHLLVDTFDVLL